MDQPPLHVLTKVERDKLLLAQCYDPADGGVDFGVGSVGREASKNLEMRRPRLPKTILAKATSARLASGLLEPKPTGH